MKKIKGIDLVLLIFLIIYSLFGLIMIVSATSASTVLRYETTSMHFFIRQLAALLIGGSVGLFILFIPTKKYKVLSYFAMIGIIFFLFVVLAYGKISGNAQSWISIGPLSIQPSEFAKTIIIIFMGVFYNNLHMMKSTKLGHYLVPLCFIAIILVLIGLEPDYGTALIVAMIVFAIFLSVPFVKKNIKSFVKMGIIPVILIGGIVLLFSDKIFSAERLSRFNFTAPCTRYQEDSGYQVCNGFIAISNGGLFGKGLGKSTQKYLYLPESHTDMIFAIICEELGSVTGSIIIIGYMIFLLRILSIAKNADNLRNSIIAYGAFWYFAIHILVNLLGLLALIPLTGVPLPFLSYGGSYTINAVIIVFIIERIAIENKQSKIRREMAKITE